MMVMVMVMETDRGRRSNGSFYAVLQISGHGHGSVGGNQGAAELEMPWPAH